MSKIKILELCHFSAGICGVWNRVKEESTRLVDLGYEVQVFSSNSTKGSKEIAPSSEDLNGIKIKRFPYWKLGGESFMVWDFFNSAIDYSPDVIIAHVYRHAHTTKALRVKNKLAKLGKKCRVILVTHAPFNEDNSERGIISSVAVNFYDRFIGKRILKKFDNLVTISNWEIPYLLKIGANKSDIVHLPNGVPEIFFKNKTKQVKSNKLLFLGRLSPVKNLDLAISFLPEINKNYFLELVGPSDGDYKGYLENLVKEKNLTDRVIFSKPIYDLKQKIKKIDSCDFFVLPSKREGMPQSLIESMARGKICIGSDVEGIKDLIKNNFNGLTFKRNDLYSITETIKKAINLSNKDLNKMSKNATIYASKFNWNLIISKLDKLIKRSLQKR